MKYYLQLQFRMTNRHLRDFGVNPVAGYCFIILAFCLLSYHFLPQSNYVPYAYAALGIVALSSFNNVARNEFLKFNYPNRQYYLLRILENQVVVLPFSIFLLSYQHFSIVAGLHSIALTFSFITFNKKAAITIPTPFYKHPFEFSTGFRKTFLLYFIALFLTYMGITVHNFNLCIFSQVLIFIITLTYYFNPEPEFYVWNFSLSPKRFLHYKISIALIYASLITLPTACVVGFFFPDYLIIIIAAQFTGYLYLITVVTGKYACYPNHMSVPYLFLICSSILFPPITLLLILFFYPNALRKLQAYLK